mmetsp:Transcript_52542/g.151444  ORF Transcript_52542/g.151444 Transcript_52542/m.151444 type:complete len:247 (+) Transcript_52542:1351-2091(+)
MWLSSSQGRYAPSRRRHRRREIELPPSLAQAAVATRRRGACRRAPWHLTAGRGKNNTLRRSRALWRCRARGRWHASRPGEPPQKRRATCSRPPGSSATPMPPRSPQDQPGLRRLRRRQGTKTMRRRNTPRPLGTRPVGSARRPGHAVSRAAPATPPPRRATQRAPRRLPHARRSRRRAGRRSARVARTSPDRPSRPPRRGATAPAPRRGSDPPRRATTPPPRGPGPAAATTAAPATADPRRWHRCG